MLFLKLEKIDKTSQMETLYFLNRGIASFVYVSTFFSLTLYSESCKIFLKCLLSLYTNVCISGVDILCQCRHKCTHLTKNVTRNSVTGSI